MNLSDGRERIVLMLSTQSSRICQTGSDDLVVAPEQAAILDALLAEGRRFFESSEDHKQPYEASKTGTMTGWRRVGVEYSQSPDRPDLNETFCYRHRDDLVDAVPHHALRDTCRKAQRVLDPIASAVMASIAEAVGVNGQVPSIRHFEESWLQLNWSRPSTANREFIQESHEDGHLVTLLFADAPGLEILDPETGWKPIWPTTSCVVAFAGENSALLVNGAVIPMMHRVRANADVTTRLSVAYFVNPDLDQILDPWVAGSRNRGVDLLRWGQQNPARFGLPTL